MTDKHDLSDMSNQQLAKIAKSLPPRSKRSKEAFSLLMKRREKLLEQMEVLYTGLDVEPEVDDDEFDLDLINLEALPKVRDHDHLADVNVNHIKATPATTSPMPKTEATDLFEKSANEITALPQDDWFKSHFPELMSNLLVNPNSTTSWLILPDPATSYSIRGEGKSAYRMLTDILEGTTSRNTSVVLGNGWQLTFPEDVSEEVLAECILAINRAISKSSTIKVEN